MVGIIWFVQIVHYPLFAAVPSQAFQAYQEKHVRRTGWVVAPPMLVEVGSALALTLYPSESLDAWLVWGGVALLLVVWGATAVFSVPLHNQLLNGFDARAHRRLLRTNWLRTLAWTLRGLFAMWLIVSA
jgi:hypothetical protein